LNFLLHTSHFFPFMASFPAALSKANRRIRKDLCQKKPWPFFFFQKLTYMIYMQCSTEHEICGT
jgi:hypothetical protein